MTAQQIQTIGNALAVDLVAWGTAAIGLALVAPARPGCCGCSAKRRASLGQRSCSSALRPESDDRGG